MRRIHRALVAAAVLAMGVALSAVAAPAAETISRETLSRKMLDYCVFTQYRTKDIDRSTMIARCGCASSKAMAGLDGASFAAPSRSGLTVPQEKAIRDAIGVCFAGK